MKNDAIKDMAAVQVLAYGDSPEDDLKPTRLPIPKPRPSEVLIEVRAAGLNPVDTKIRRGYLRVAVGLPANGVLGMDVAGVVVAVGSKAGAFSVGDEVYASPGHRTMGCYAEYVAVDHRHVSLKPTHASFAEAAGLPLAGLTAWDSLVTAGKLKAGQRVLIQAGAGGVGSIAIQLAKHLGATVVTTCSERNRQFCLDLGADEVIDYHKQDYADAAGSCDLVVDCLGPSDVAKAMTCTKRGGRIVSLASGMPEHARRFGAVLGTLVTVGRMAKLWLMGRIRAGVKVLPIARKPSGDNLRRLAELVDAKIIAPIVDRSFALAEAGKAHAYVETGRARGKVVLLPEGCS